MKPYHKILNVFARDPETKKIDPTVPSTPAFEYLWDNAWHVEEKVDGMNIRVMWDGETITFNGRTDRAQLPETLVLRLQGLFPEDKFSDNFSCSDMCLYGEGYGCKIQQVGSSYIPDGQDFILFDVNINGTWLDREDVYEVAETLGIRSVPYLGKMTLWEARNLVAEGLPSQLGDLEAEGVVVRPAVRLSDVHGNRVIGKIVARDFQAA